MLPDYAARRRELDSVIADCKRIMDPSEGFAVLDTETTGLGGDDRICDIAVTTPAGDVVIDQRIDPQIPVPPGAARIHGLTNDALRGEPTWDIFFPYFLAELTRRGIRGLVIYNAAFDMRMIRQSSAAYPSLSEGTRDFFDAYAPAWCAMHLYSAWCGEYQEWSDDYRWQRLPGGDHTALGDCRAAARAIARAARQDPPDAGARW